MSEPTLSPMDRTARLTRTRAAMADAGCDALIVTKPQNIRWLSGFTGSNGTAVVGPDSLLLITDGRYATQIERQLAEAGVAADVNITREIGPPIVESLTDVDRVGLEAGHVTWSAQKQFASWLEDREPVATEDLIEAVRRIKDQGEIDRLRRAAAIADEALATIKPLLSAGSTERAVARALEGAMFDLGADELSFATIVAGGPNSAKPHAVPSDRVIESGDMVVMDFGAKVDGYGSDMTRSFLVGDTSDHQRALFEAVIEAQAAGVAAVRAGVEEREIDRVCRDSLAEREVDGVNLAEAFIHGTGHGIGLEIHENPILSTRATGILRSGYVVTVEPGVYFPDLGGVRIEDSVVVTESGCEPITMSSKSPTIELA